MNYSLDNVKKFLEDNEKWIGNLAEGILARANACAVRGIIPESLTREIMENDYLVGEFHRVVFFDVNHTNLIAATMTKNAEEDRENVLSENLKKAIDLIVEAKQLIKMDWDNGIGNRDMTFGCYKALNAVTQVLSDEIEGTKEEERDEDYVFSRLMESFSSLADYYGISIRDALTFSGCFSHDKIEKMFPLSDE